MIKNLRYIIGLLLLSWVVFPIGLTKAGSASSGEVDGLQSRILFSILNLRFGEADSLLQKSLELNPVNPGMLCMQNYLEFLDALIVGDRGSFEEYLAASGKRIEVIRAGLKQHPGSLTDLSSIHLQSSVLCANYGEMYNAARHFYYSHRYLKQVKDDLPEDGRYLRNMGLSTMIIASIPEEYRWVLKVFRMKGSTGEGLAYLEEYHEATIGAERVEACLILLFAGYVLDPWKQETNLPAAGEAYGECMECRECGDMTLYRYAVALGDLGSGHSRRVIDKLDGYQQEESEKLFPYLDLILGEALLNSLDTSAQVFLKGFVGNHRGEHYRHYVWNKLSWCHALNGDTNLYQEARQEVLNAGEPGLDADRQALSEALDTIPLNPDLLKARLLFDGGYYPEALDQVSDSSAIHLIHSRDTVEYNYRLGRIHHRLGDYDRAIAFYEEAIELGFSEAWHFAPNAALHLGMIYENEGNSAKAIEYYRLCLKINRSAYKKSIDYRARQGISRLED